MSLLKVLYHVLDKTSHLELMLENILTGFVEILLMLCVDGNENILHILTYCAAVCVKRIRSLGHSQIFMKELS